MMEVRSLRNVRGGGRGTGALKVPIVLLSSPIKRITCGIHLQTLEARRARSTADPTEREREVDEKRELSETLL